MLPSTLIGRHRKAVKYAVYGLAFTACNKFRSSHLRERRTGYHNVATAQTDINEFRAKIKRQTRTESNRTELVWDHDVKNSIPMLESDYSDPVGQ